jgi:hypothetical protein
MGTLMEKSLFGGCIEMKGNDPDAFMELDDIGVYPSTATCHGNVLNIDQSDVKADGTIIFVLGAPFRSNKLPSITRDLGADEDEETCCEILSHDEEYHGYDGVVRA